MNSPLEPQEHITLTAKDLVVAYGSEVALEISELDTTGRIIALIGHNGSGKSTLIKTILELLMPRRGKIQTTWDSTHDAQTLSPEKHMAFAPEHGAVFEDLSVESYIRLWCRIKHSDGAYYINQGSKYIEKLNIAPIFSKLGRELSKGQRRRVQAVVGFITNPKLFLFDEPFDGLDIAQSNKLADIMLEESDHMALIISSHRMGVVERLADCIIVLSNGGVAAFGPVEDVCEKLSGQSVILSSRNHKGACPSEVLSLLKQEYSSCLIGQIGSQVSITGNEVNEDSLREFLSKRNKLNGFEIHSTRPALHDAMHYHLRRKQG